MKTEGVWRLGGLCLSCLECYRRQEASLPPGEERGWGQEPGVLTLTVECGQVE